MEELYNLLRISDLIKKHLAGTLAGAEREELERWLAAGSNNAAYLQMIEQEAREMENGHAMLQVNLTQGMAAINRKIENWERRKKRQRRLWWGVAAAAALSGAVLLVTYLAPRSIHSQQPPAVAHDLPPGGNQARLLLANGSTMVLGVSGDTTFNQGGIAQVSQQKGRLLYRQAKDAGNELVFNTLITPRGGEYRIRLSDGTNVWLNAASTLRFPVGFSGKSRKVEITGEAYFEVAANAALPFVVSTGNAEIQVLGTSFNINAYPEETSIRAALVSGAIKVKTGKASRVLQPGEMATVLPDGTAVAGAANIEAATAWKNGYFQFQNDSLSTIMRQVARWYNIEVNYQGNVSQLFTGKVPRHVNISTLLKILESTGWAHFRIEGGKITVTP